MTAARVRPGNLFIDWDGDIAIEQYPDGDLNLGPVWDVLEDERIEVLLPSEIDLSENYILTRSYLDSLGSPWSKFIGVWGTHSHDAPSQRYLRIGVWFGKLLDQAKLSKRWGLPQMDQETLDLVLQELERYLEKEMIGIDQEDQSTVDVLAWSPAEAERKINAITRFFKGQPDLMSQLARL